MVLAFVAFGGLFTATGMWRPLIRFVTHADSYTFIALQGDGKTPVAYDSCRPIHYVIRQDGAPEGGQQTVLDAVARVSQVTGLTFVYDGSTSEAPSRRRPGFQPDRYGQGWAPVLITWATAKEAPGLAGNDVVGQGGSQSVSGPGGARVFVTGAVDLDSENVADIQRRPDGDKVVRALVLHELGHLVGLNHTDAKSQVMHERVESGVTDYGAGDRTGLAALGKGKCFPTPLTDVGP